MNKWMELRRSNNYFQPCHYSSAPQDKSPTSLDLFLQAFAYYGDGAKLRNSLCKSEWFQLKIKTLRNLLLKQHERDLGPYVVIPSILLTAFWVSKVIDHYFSSKVLELFMNLIGFIFLSQLFPPHTKFCLTYQSYYILTSSTMKESGGRRYKLHPQFFLRLATSFRDGSNAERLATYYQVGPDHLSQCSILYQVIQAIANRKHYSI